MGKAKISVHLCLRPMTLNDIQQSYQNFLKTQNFKGRPANLYEPMNYMMALGGKRARPLLTLASAACAGGNVEQTLPIAHAMEVFHNFTLVHDDIMDHANLRRGNPTVHIKWNLPVAILSGDNLLVAAYDLLVSSQVKNKDQILQLFNKTAREVCEGQQMDMDFAMRNDVTEAEYIEMIRLKTAVLLGCSAACGALAAGKSMEVAELFYQFAIHMGLAFQMQDDYLDVFGDPSITGKKPGGDIIEDKKTWFYIAANLKEPSMSAWTFKNEEEKVQKITAFFEQLDLNHEISAKIKDHENTAIQYLERLNKEGCETELLQDLLRWLGGRKG